MKGIILISGKAQSGKDTVANIIKERYSQNGYMALVAHNASLLKFILKEWYAWDGKKDEHGRKLLQIVGTDIIRKRDPDFWVNFIILMTKILGEEIDYLIVPDTRFPNEIWRFEEEFGNTIPVKTIRVHRSKSNGLAFNATNHLSECALDTYEDFDYHIYNDGSKGDLKQNVIEMLYTLL